MSPRTPKLSGREVVRILSRYGFVVTRIRGSHHMLKHPDGRATVVPVHRGEIIGPGLLSKILKHTELANEDFRR
jgi:predicted RNA binding protein YcfA (HicA-like mRNA interferase family)